MKGHEQLELGRALRDEGAALVDQRIHRVGYRTSRHPSVHAHPIALWVGADSATQEAS